MIDVVYCYYSLYVLQQARVVVAFKLLREERLGFDKREREEEIDQI